MTELHISFLSSVGTLRLLAARNAQSFSSAAHNLERYNNSGCFFQWPSPSLSANIFSDGCDQDEWPTIRWGPGGAGKFGSKMGSSIAISLPHIRTKTIRFSLLDFTILSDPVGAEFYELKMPEACLIVSRSS
jgi:hypothetical protein